MEKACILFILIFLILKFGQSYLIDQNYIVDSNTSGIWQPNYTSAQPQSSYGPSRYFLCGFGLGEMKFQINLWNCNCRYVLFQQVLQWKCSLCPNVFWTKSNLFKGIFCSFSDWNLKIQKITQTGNKNSGNVRYYSCPIGQYVSGVAVRNTGNEQGQGLGFNGMLIKCQTRNSVSSSIVKDNYDYPLSQLSKTQQGNLASSYKIKYKQNGELLGIQIGFEQTKNLKRQYKRQLTTPYTLNDKNIWANFPELNMNINVEQSARYIVQYNIISWTNIGYLCTRLLINDKQLPEFRSISSGVVHHQNKATVIINLQAGVNKIQVQYRASAEADNVIYSDWNCAILKVTQF